MNKLVKKILPFGFKRKMKEDLGVPSAHWSFQNLKKKGFVPAFALDIGAFEGNWAIDFAEVFPDSQVLMMEAQAKKEQKLIALTGTNKNFSVFMGLLSSSDHQKVQFYENETASHVHSGNDTEDTVTVQTRTVDSIIKEKNLPAPNLLKLDVQGHEIEVLKGAEHALLSAEICMIEVSLLDLDGSPLILEVMQFMDTAGFQLYDVCQFMRRPYDKALYQMDVLFVKKDSKLVSEKVW